MTLAFVLEYIDTMSTLGIASSPLHGVAFNVV